MIRKLVAAMAFSVTLGLVGLVAVPVTAAGAVSAPHDVVVSPNPVDTTPHVLDGRVYAIARVGDWVVVGGTFSQVRDQGQSVVLARSNLFAYDAATGRIAVGFAPQVDGAVLALEADPSGAAVFVGGGFATVDGTAMRGLAKVGLPDGRPVAGFSATTTAVVNDLAVRGSSLYVGGAFGRIRGVDRGGLAAVDVTTGAVDGDLALAVTMPMGTGPAAVKELDVTPDGSKLVVVGNFTLVGGLARTQMAIVDLATAPASVSSWQTDRYGNVCNPIFDTYMRDIDISPDGAYVVVVTTGGPYGTSTLCDTAARWDLDRTGPGQQPVWVDWTGGDTLLSVAVTGAAVYVGGHQRWANNAGGADSAMPYSVEREGITALDPRDGRPIGWNPGRSRGYGATALVATPEGLFVGSDTDRLGGEYHARLGMFPVAGGSAPVLGGTTSSPTNLYLVEGDGDLVRTAYSGGPSGAASVVSGPGVDGRDWAPIRGGFSAAGRVYTFHTDGVVRSRTYNGSSFGPDAVVPTTIDLWYATSIAYVDGWLLYTRSGDGRLYRRGLTLDGFVIDPIETVVSGAGDGPDWNGVTGLTAVDGRLLAATSSGHLTSTAVSQGVPVAGTQATISGPGIDQRSWVGVDLFAHTSTK